MVISYRYRQVSGWNQWIEQWYSKKVAVSGYRMLDVKSYAQMHVQFPFAKRCSKKLFNEQLQLIYVKLYLYMSTVFSVYEFPLPHIFPSNQRHEMANDYWKSNVSTKQWTECWKERFSYFWPLLPLFGPALINQHIFHSAPFPAWNETCALANYMLQSDKVIKHAKKKLVVSVSKKLRRNGENHRKLHRGNILSSIWKKMLYSRVNKTLTSSADWSGVSWKIKILQLQKISTFKREKNRILKTRTMGNFSRSLLSIWKLSKCLRFEKVSLTL